jgi:hypothetical protein
VDLRCAVLGGRDGAQWVIPVSVVRGVL